MQFLSSRFLEFSGEMATHSACRHTELTFSLDLTRHAYGDEWTCREHYVMTRDRDDRRRLSCPF